MLQLLLYLPSKVCTFWVIHFQQSHQLFSRLINHSTVSLTIPLGDYCMYFWGVLISSDLVNCITRCKQKQRNGWDSPFKSNITHLHCTMSLFSVINTLDVGRTWNKVGNHQPIVFIKENNMVNALGYFCRYLLWPSCLCDLNLRGLIVSHLYQSKLTNFCWTSPAATS